MIRQGNYLWPSVVISTLCPSSNLVCVITLSVSNRSVETKMNVYTDYARFKTRNFLLRIHFKRS